MSDVIKTTAVKAPATTAPSSVPFFNKSDEGGFFSSGAQHFFFSSLPLQAKKAGTTGNMISQNTAAVQRKSGTGDKEEDIENRGDEPMQRKQIPGLSNEGISDEADGATSESNMLPDEIRGNMEATFGQDFSGVSIHQNSSLARDLDALAFTQGENISFAPGRYDPSSKQGQELIGHELTHVVQQRSGSVRADVQERSMAINEDEGLEKEADDMGKKAAQQTGTPVLSAGQPQKNNTTAAGAPTQFRLPSYKNLTQIFKDLSAQGLTEEMIKNMVTTALIRMESHGYLRSKKPVPVIIKKIFPGGGLIVEREFNKIVDVKNRSRIYENVMDVKSPIAAADRVRLKSAMQQAIEICRKTSSMTTQLKSIFGTKEPVAKAIYQKAASKLTDLKDDAIMDKAMDTDYNKDDQELSLGGFANSKKMHLESDIVKVVKVKETITTLIHEATHMADSTVKDNNIYYPPLSDKDAFAGASEDTKIKTAAYFEEFPKRWLDKSVYPHHLTFTPGIRISGGGALKPEDIARGKVDEYFTAAWDAGVDAHFYLRKIHMENVPKAPAVVPLNAAKRGKAIEISKAMGLSLHKQTKGSESVTQLDIILSEGAISAITTMGVESRKLHLKPPPASTAAVDIEAAKQRLIMNTIIHNKTLLGDPAKDKALLDWLVSKYKTGYFL